VSITLIQLEHFVVLAEELNFTRASERLSVGQQGLSSSIRTLEREVGARLFERSKHHVELTAEGQALLGPAQRTIEQLEQGLTAVRGLVEGRVGALKLGTTVSGEFGIVSRTLAVFEAARPNIEVVVSRAPTASNVDQLRSGGLDAALVRPPIDTSGLTLINLLEEPLTAAVAADDHLAAAHRVRPQDLAGHGLVTFPRRTSPGLHDHIGAWLGPTRARLRRVIERPDEEMMVREVAAGGGVTIVFLARALELGIAGVALVPLDPPLMGELALAHREGDPSPLLGAFVDAVALASRAAGHK